MKKSKLLKLMAEYKDPGPLVVSFPNGYDRYCSMVHHALRNVKGKYPAVKTSSTIIGGRRNGNG